MYTWVEKVNQILVIHGLADLEHKGLKMVVSMAVVLPKLLVVEVVEEEHQTFDMVEHQ
tara:strand:- start:179 stop:352 length:174 start_codon:yes stop_codon:yes gene_type:complete